MSSLPTNVIVDITLEPSENFDHADYTSEPIHEEIYSEAPRTSKRSRTTKCFSDDFTIYFVDDTPKTIAEAFASPNAVIGKKRYVVRLTQLSLMELWSWLIDHMVVNSCVVSGS
jgi:hypothetical protein